MNRTAPLSVIIVMTIFLAFLGMKLPSLEEAGKPKPRPRAVVKSASKASPYATEVKHPRQQNADACNAVSAHLFPIQAVGIVEAAPSISSYSGITCSTSSSRSPPKSYIFT